MPTFIVSRYFGKHHRVTPIDAATAGDAVGLAMIEDGVNYEVHRKGRRDQVYELTPNGLCGKSASEAGDMQTTDGLGT